MGGAACTVGQGRQAGDYLGKASLCLSEDGKVRKGHVSMRSQGSMHRWHLCIYGSGVCSVKSASPSMSTQKHAP